MRKSLMKLLGAGVALMVSAQVAALGLGGINVSSALGQPLKADIELVSAGKLEKSSMVARIASPDAYRGAGLEYPYGSKFKFQIESRANGEPYLRVTSAQPINDPFVSLLVELSWSSGRLLREYTFLLDPPGYVAEQPVEKEVQVVAPAVAEFEPEVPRQEVASESVTPDARKSAPPMRATAPGDEKALATARARATQPKPAADIAAGSVTVQRGDTLSKIAEANRPVDVSLERMLVALYRANANQFDAKNMNRIKTGKILRLPSQDEILDIGQRDAASEIRAQSADWNAYRQRLASAAPVSTRPLDSQQAVSGKITSSVTDKTPVAKESSKEVLKLSKGEAPGDQAAAGGKSTSVQDKKNVAQEEAIAKAKALKEEQDRLALLEQNLKDMQRLAELKSEEAAALALKAASAVAAESAVEAASAVKPAKVAKPKPVPKVVEPEPSLVDQILAEPLYLAGGAVALLGLGGLGFMMARRKKGPAASIGAVEELGATTGRIATPVAPSPDTGDFTATAVMETPAEATHTDDVDPISEADLFLNFGRDAQAEEILKEALLNTPNDHRIHLKLLGIYANRKDTGAFAAIASQLQDSGDDEAWQQAAAMGRKLDPENPMYGGGGTIEDADSATMQTAVLSVPPDFLLDDASEQNAAPSQNLDFDLGNASGGADEQDFQQGSDSTMALTQDDRAAAQADEVMDFDLTSTNPSMVAPIAMDFDVTSTNPSLNVPDFNMDEPRTEPTAAVKAEASSDLNDLVFDVTSIGSSVQDAPQPDKTEEPGQPPDDAMAFTLDFPSDEEEKPASRRVDEEMGLAGISLNLDEAEMQAGATEEEHDEHWHDVATKLDLAKAYQEMGDVTGAREILEDVLREGDAAQQEAAQSILDQLLD
ncbi:MAG: FimV/HubP family polar landmark protein [Gallionella sp.]|nr:FimV/HubP family polar landmark protein [Gallionella sp.]